MKQLKIKPSKAFQVAERIISYGLTSSCENSSELCNGETEEIRSGAIEDHEAWLLISEYFYGYLELKSRVSSLENKIKKLNQKKRG